MPVLLVLTDEFGKSVSPLIKSRTESLFFSFLQKTLQFKEKHASTFHEFAVKNIEKYQNHDD